jgi:hypothetical protein
MSEFYEDKTLTCRDCKQNFTFTGGEQRFFNERQFTEPTRCKACRQARKVEKEARGGEHPQRNGFTPAPQGAPSPSRRPVVYDAPPLASGYGNERANSGGRKRQGGGKRRDEDNGWGGGYDD